MVGTTQTLQAGARRTGSPSPALRLTLSGAGQHALTALDAAGRYEQVLFSVR